MATGSKTAVPDPSQTRREVQTRSSGGAIDVAVESRSFAEPLLKMTRTAGEKSFKSKSTNSTWIASDEYDWMASIQVFVNDLAAMGIDSRAKPPQPPPAKLSRRGPKAKYEHLKVSYSNDNWVLFDPHHHQPAVDALENAPHCMQKRGEFQPGKRKFLEFNLESESIRIKSVSACNLLVGKFIIYTPAGPKLVSEDEWLDNLTPAQQAKARKVRAARTVRAVDISDAGLIRRRSSRCDDNNAVENKQARSSQPRADKECAKDTIGLTSNVEQPPIRKARAGKERATSLFDLANDVETEQNPPRNLRTGKESNASTIDLTKAAESGQSLFQNLNTGKERTTGAIDLAVTSLAKPSQVQSTLNTASSIGPDVDPAPSQTELAPPANSKKRPNDTIAEPEQRPTKKGRKVASVPPTNSAAVKLRQEPTRRSIRTTSMSSNSSSGHSDLSSDAQCVARAFNEGNSNNASEELAEMASSEKRTHSPAADSEGVIKFPPAKKNKTFFGASTTDAAEFLKKVNKNKRAHDFAFHEEDTQSSPPPKKRNTASVTAPSTYKSSAAVTMSGPKKRGRPTNAERAARQALQAAAAEVAAEPAKNTLPAEIQEPVPKKSIARPGRKAKTTNVWSDEIVAGAQAAPAAETQKPLQQVTAGRPKRQAKDSSDEVVAYFEAATAVQTQKPSVIKNASHPGCKTKNSKVKSEEVIIDSNEDDDDELA